MIRVAKYILMLVEVCDALLVSSQSLLDPGYRASVSKASSRTRPLHHGLFFKPSTRITVGIMSVSSIAASNSKFSLTPGP